MRQGSNHLTLRHAPHDAILQLPHLRILWNLTDFVRHRYEAESASAFERPPIVFPNAVWN